MFCIWELGLEPYCTLNISQAQITDHRNLEVLSCCSTAMDLSCNMYIVICFDKPTDSVLHQHLQKLSKSYWTCFAFKSKHIFANLATFMWVQRRKITTQFSNSNLVQSHFSGSSFKGFSNVDEKLFHLFYVTVCPALTGAAFGKPHDCFQCKFSIWGQSIGGQFIGLPTSTDEKLFHLFCVTACCALSLWQVLAAFKMSSWPLSAGRWKEPSFKVFENQYHRGWSI